MLTKSHPRSSPLPLYPPLLTLYRPTTHCALPLGSRYLKGRSVVLTDLEADLGDLPFEIFEARSNV